MCSMTQRLGNERFEMKYRLNRFIDPNFIHWFFYKKPMQPQRDHVWVTISPPGTSMRNRYELFDYRVEATFSKLPRRYQFKTLIGITINNGQQVAPTHEWVQTLCRVWNCNVEDSWNNILFSTKQFRGQPYSELSTSSATQVTRRVNDGNNTSDISTVGIKSII